MIWREIVAKILNGIEDLVGNTPIIRLNRFKKNENLKADILAKLEWYNPSGSVKDRVSNVMLEEAEEFGLIKQDTVIIEPTSGNTGIGLAAVCAAKGYRLIIVMPENMSKERIKLIKAYGAEVVLTDAKLGMKGAIQKAIELTQDYTNSYIPSQFTNPSNPGCHRKTTGPEIWEATEGNVDVLVAGIGTGGSITGIGEYLKSKNPDVKVIGVEPISSAVISGKEPGEHNIQGIGAGFVPNTLNIDMLDDIVCISEENAYEMAREIAITEGLLIGISSGAALFAAKQIAAIEENKDKNIVVIFPDGGERYLTTELFVD